MAIVKVGTGKYTYELVENFAKLPDGETFGLISRVTTDSRNRLYVFQRKDPAVLARWDVTPTHGMGIDAAGNIYIGLTKTARVDKYVRMN